MEDQGLALPTQCRADGSGVLLASYHEKQNFHFNCRYIVMYVGVWGLACVLCVPVASRRGEVGPLLVASVRFHCATTQQTLCQLRACNHEDHAFLQNLDHSTWDGQQAGNASERLPACPSSCGRRIQNGVNVAPRVARRPETVTKRYHLQNSYIRKEGWSGVGVRHAAVWGVQ